MQITRSDIIYDDTRKQAVVDRLNELRDAKPYDDVDWGELFAELIEAYMTTTYTQDNSAVVPWLVYT